MKVLVKCTSIAADLVTMLPQGVVYVDQKLEPKLAANIKNLLKKYPKDIETFKGKAPGYDVRGSRSLKGATPELEESDADDDAGEDSELYGLGISKTMVTKLNNAGVTDLAQLEGKSIVELVELEGIGEATATQIFEAFENNLNSNE